MGHEATKAANRRALDSVFADFYIHGKGIDICCGDDPLTLHKDKFPKMESCDLWDLEQGDAQYMTGVESNTFDFVHSSHGLEHMVNPGVAIAHWLRILKLGGHLIVTVPERFLYEKDYWPSRFNGDHKTRWEIYNSFPGKDGISLITLLTSISNIKIKKIQLIEHGYDYNLPIEHDATASPIAECAIEFVVQKIK